MLVVSVSPRLNSEGVIVGKAQKNFRHEDMLSSLPNTPVEPTPEDPEVSTPEPEESEPATPQEPAKAPVKRARSTKPKAVDDNEQSVAHSDGEAATEHKV